jgi:ribonuclease R
MAWLAAGLHCSANERRADEASRDVEAWLKCKYMKEHLGEEYGGVVTAATSFGVFVTLDAMYVEGLVHITELGGEYFRFDEARQELRGERTGTRYAIGTRVRIQVSRVDLDGRKIDFRLVHEGDGLVSRAMQEKNAGRDSKLRVAHGDRFDIEASVRPASFKNLSGKRTVGKPARPTKAMEKLTTSQKKAPRKRR